MYAATDGEGEPLQGVTLMASVPDEIERKRHADDNDVTALLDSGASGHSFDDLGIPGLKHRPQDCTSYLSTPWKILKAGGVMMHGTLKGVFEGLIADSHREQHLARVAILAVPGIGRNSFTVNNSSNIGHRFDFRCQQPQVGGG